MEMGAGGGRGAASSAAARASPNGPSSAAGARGEGRWGRGRPARRARAAGALHKAPRRGGDRRAPAQGTARSPRLSPRRFRRAAAGVCLLVPRRLPRRMASCDRGDTQFPELSGGESGSRAGSGLLAGAPAPRLTAVSRRAPAPARRCRPGGTRGGGRRGLFQRRKWLLDARERLICNWGRADWCSWRRRGGRSGGGGGGGWPLSNGEGGGGDVAAEGAALGCATRRCHHCTGANSGGGAGSYFPLLPRCCFCRLGRRSGREDGEGGRGRRRGPGAPQRAAGAARCAPCGAAAQLPPRGSPFRGPGPLAPTPRTRPSSQTTPPPRPQGPRPALPSLPSPPGPGFPTSGSPSRARGGGRSPGAPGTQRANKKSGRFKRAFETR